MDLWFAHAAQSISFRAERAGTHGVFGLWLCPIAGTDVPGVSAELPNVFCAGDDRVELTVEAFKKTWTLGRDLGVWRCMGLLTKIGVFL